MIGNLKYDEVEEISNELERCAAIIKEIVKDDEISELIEFSSTVDGYAKYLKTTLNLYKDADDALIDLK